MDEKQLFARATHCLNAGDAEGLSDLVRAHPGLLNLRSDDSDGLTLLHSAAKRGSTTLVQALLAVGADPADRAGHWVEDGLPEGGYYDPGWTPVMLAARGGYLQVVNLLLDHGASVHDAGQYGDTALHFAAVANSIETANLLLGRGASIDRECRVRRFDEALDWHTVGTPLHAAAKCGWPEMIRCLLGHGAAVDPRLCPCGRTPLFYASARGHSKAVEALLRAGADPNRRETRPGYGFTLDYTPLHYAAENGHAEVVRLLLGAGADRSAIVTYLKQGAEQLAVAAGHKDVVRVLQGAQLPTENWSGLMKDLREAAAEIQGNLDFVEKELQSQPVPRDVKDTVRAVTQSVGRAVQGLHEEIRSLQAEVEPDPRAASNATGTAGVDPLTRTQAMRQAITQTIQTLDAVVRRMWDLSEKDDTQYGVTSILVGESAANILNAFAHFHDALDLIEDTVAPHRPN